MMKKYSIKIVQYQAIELKSLYFNTIEHITHLKRVKLIMTPVLAIDDVIITFEAQEEEMSARTHFIKECGWTESQFRKIKDYPFFCAKVSAWKDGKELATEYLGCCSYKTEEEFYTTYKSDYFADMVIAVLLESGNAGKTFKANELLKRI